MKWILILFFTIGISNCDERCFGELGCFSTGGVFFHPIYRPINLLPQSRELINIKFLLYNNDHRTNPIEIKLKNESDIKNVPFNGNFPTKIIVHGFIDNMNWTTDWMQVMALALIEDNQKLNVILVDWSGGNKPLYTQAVANARVVGAEIARLIQILHSEESAPLSSFHIIAHSLGAHIAGYAGERLNGSLSRITGLAPAGPLFDHMPPEVRLDASDAEYVDAIHTDARNPLSLEFGLGTTEYSGHVAFYPNGGHRQPHCDLNRKFQEFHIDSTIDAIRNFALCDHQQAVDFYIEAIKNKHCIPIAYKCQTFDYYLRGECHDCAADGSSCAILGPRAEEFRSHKHADGSPIQMILKMGSELHHYCLQQYRISIEFDQHPRALTSNLQYGALNLTVHSDKGDGPLDIGGPRNYEHGHTTILLGTTAINVGTNLTRVHVKWDNINHGIGDLIKDHRIYIKKVTVEPLWISDEKIRKTEIRQFCPNDNTIGLLPMHDKNLNICQSF